MSDFSERRAELLQSIETNIPAGDQAAPEIALLRTAAGEWTEDRAERLKAALALLSNPDEAPVADDWKSVTAEFRSDLERWSNALSSLSAPAEWASGLMDRSRGADEKFVWGIDDAMTVAEARDFLVSYAATVRDLTENLSVKWQAVLAQRGVTAQQQQQAFAEILQKLQEGFVEEQSLYDKAKAGTGDLIVKAKEQIERLPEGVTSAAGDVISAVTGVEIGNPDNVIVIAGAAIEAYRGLLSGTKEGIDRFERFLNEEFGSVVYLFTSFREQTHVYVEQFNVSKIEEREAQVDKDLSTLISTVSSSSANQKDAEEFADRARIAMRPHVDAAKSAWDAFLKEHDRRFVGDIADDVQRAIWDREPFDHEFTAFEANDPLAPIEKWQAASRDLFDAETEGVAAESLEAFRKAITEKVDEIDPRRLQELLTRLREVIENADAARKAIK